MNNTIIANYSLPSLLELNTIDLDVKNKKIINLTNPINNNDACNKLYVDNKFSSVVIPTTINTLNCDTDYSL